MYWVLIFISINLGVQDVSAHPMGVYDRMDKCFLAREALMARYDVIGEQAICMKTRMQEVRNNNRGNG